MSPSGGGTRFCKSRAEECAGRRELCEAFHFSSPADTETGEAPFPQLIFFFSPPRSSPSFTDVFRTLKRLTCGLLALMDQKLPAGRITPSWTAGWRHHSSSISPFQVTNLLLLLCRNVCSHALAPEALSLQSPFCPAFSREGAHTSAGLGFGPVQLQPQPSTSQLSGRWGNLNAGQTVAREQTSMLKGAVRIQHCSSPWAAWQDPCKALLLPAFCHLSPHCYLCLLISPTIL